MTDKPNITLRNKIITDDVIILSKDQLKHKSKEFLVNYRTYLKTTLETLAGKQVWKMIHSYCDINEEISQRKDL